MAKEVRLTNTFVAVPRPTQNNRLFGILKVDALERHDSIEFIRSPGFVENVSRLFRVDFKPGLRNVAARVRRL